VGKRFVTFWRPFQHSLTQRYAGKPGFGKTKLCKTLIESLQRRNTREIGQDRRQAVIFFYFDKQRVDSINSCAVWRAVLAQLWQQMTKFDEDVVDTFLMYRESHPTGQAVASANEVFAVLQLLVHRLDQLTLVVDGMDECEDQLLFLSRLSILFDGPAKTRVALFSRPTVTLPPFLAAYTDTLELHEALNLEDIEAFLRPRIVNLERSGLPVMTPDETGDLISKIATRANGVFIWAHLFIEYLQSRHLSIRKRLDALRNLNRLEGLDMLYLAILQSLSHQGQEAWSSTIQIFEFVLCSARPLHITELHQIIAIPVDRKFHSEDVVPNFAVNMAYYSGALLELDGQGFVKSLTSPFWNIWTTREADYRERTTQRPTSSSIDAEETHQWRPAACHTTSSPSKTNRCPDFRASAPTGSRSFVTTLF
jgi:NACHT domain-containing protein